MYKNSTASRLANLTFSLLANCQEKEVHLAKLHRLTQAEFRCLRLFGTDESLNNKTIAERMNLSPSRLTRINDGLVKKRYIRREIDPNDRRNMRVNLSKKGKSLVQQLNKDYVDIHKEILQDINPSQHEQLIMAMTHLLEALEKWLKKTE
ncbi:MAG: MarR family transcriptional regulator [Bacteroidetes bacterium]|nr:MarR family transcriptional regulator [Bacteroidota bacterium]MCH8032369.1 MarR family transcriptional regulator [Bacteroidota bacterium]